MIEVLRLGHRRKRDERLTTHVCLVARAFGADRVLVSEKDPELEATISDVVKRFGGHFEVATGVNWRGQIKNFKGTKVHLTMYGMPLKDILDDIPRSGKADNLLVIVGSEKVPGDVYRLVDFNVAVGNQPHSEAAALAVFLDRYTEGGWQSMLFEGGELEIVPSPHGKGVRKR
jgi:tRNA (cytidine56-2'-O)-methyltransferase